MAELAGCRFDVTTAPGQPEGPAQALVRPEAIVVGDEGQLTGTVRSVLYRGGIWEAVLDLDAGGSLTVAHDAPMRVGDRLALRIKRAWVLPG
ncbi:MAG: TOBE domain-containing protein, partial [Mameliella sp.]|nr:TOBE domain-containing protein [Mameliella sp.]